MKKIIFVLLILFTQTINYSYASIKGNSGSWADYKYEKADRDYDSDPLSPVEITLWGIIIALLGYALLKHNRIKTQRKKSLKTPVKKEKRNID